MNVGDLLTRTARWKPDAPAITWRGRTRTYGELDERSELLASHLRELGAEPGARVGVYMWNRPELLEAMFACFKAGMCIVPLNARFAADEVAYHVTDPGMSVLLSDQAHATTARDAAGDAALVIVDDDLTCVAGQSSSSRADSHAVDGSDLAWLFYTSGTTGRPKGAMLTHAALTFITVSWLADLVPLSERDVTLHTAPLTHGAGFHALAAVARGAHQIITDSPQFVAETVLETMRSWRVTNTWLVPTQITMLTDFLDGASADVPDLQYVVYGGAPFPTPELERALASFGDVFVQLYAQGETPMTATVLRREEHRVGLLGSAGRVRPGVELRIVDEADVERESGEIGEVVVRGPSVMTGYWQRPTETEEALRGGWLHTGDLGHVDDQGYLHLSDRLKDMIISGGSNVYATEVEQVLYRHPGVAEVAVVGVPDRLWGEHVVAFVVSASGHAPESSDLDAYCKEALSAYKRPRTYRYVPDLPRNSYGKVQKSELRRAFDAVDDEEIHVAAGELLPAARDEGDARR